MKNRIGNALFFFACNALLVACKDDGNGIKKTDLNESVEQEVYNVVSTTSASDSTVIVFCHYLAYPLTVISDETGEEFVCNNIHDLSTNWPSENWHFKYPIYLETIPDKNRIAVESEEKLEEIREECE